MSTGVWGVRLGIPATLLRTSFVDFQMLSLLSQVWAMLWPWRQLVYFYQEGLDLEVI